MDLLAAAEVIQQFQAGSLTARISAIERSLQSSSLGEVTAQLEDLGVTDDVLGAAVQVKRVAGQINVLIHALGILLVLPDLLESDEVVEYVSLGAGNTGRRFDLETDRRVAEFKFIAWRGGSEAIRQNSLFKDFYLLEAHQTTKRKQMFVLDDVHPARFFAGGRSLASVMSRNRKLWDDFRARFDDRFATVSEYYEAYGDRVELASLQRMFPGRFADYPATEEGEA